MEKRWTIYCHIHIDSGRRYIGLTSKTMMARWNGHISLSKRSNGHKSHFIFAIRKYGKDAFSHEVLEVCHSLEVANLAEECWIEFYETRNPEKGFNLAKGGTHIPHPIRKNPWDDPFYRSENTPKLIARTHTPSARANNAAAIRTEAARSNASLKAKEYWQNSEYRAKVVRGTRDYVTEEVRQKMSDFWKEQARLGKCRIQHDDVKESWLNSMAARRGQTSPFKGKKHSPDTLALISSKLSGKSISESHKLNISKAREEQYLKNIDSPKRCRIHGVLNEDGILMKTKKNGRIHRLCKECRRNWHRKRHSKSEVAFSITTSMTE